MFQLILKVKKLWFGKIFFETGPLHCFYLPAKHFISICGIVFTSVSLMFPKLRPVISIDSTNNLGQGTFLLLFFICLKEEFVDYKNTS